MEKRTSLFSKFSRKYSSHQNKKINYIHEFFAGILVYVTISYVAFVCPAILAQAGMPQGAVFSATCWITTFGCLLMALLSNMPVILAPGMGMNAYFAYVLVMRLHYTWQSALGISFVTGVIFFILTLTKVRSIILSSIPDILAKATCAGIGMLLIVISLKQVGDISGLSLLNIQFNQLFHIHSLLFMLGLILICILQYFKIPGALLIAIACNTCIGIMLHQVYISGIVSLPPSIAPTFFALHIHPSEWWNASSVIIGYILLAFFDSTGALIALTSIVPEWKWQSNQRIKFALWADSVSFIASSFMGTSMVSPYIESSVGIRAGGRTGMVAVVVALLFLITPFFAPLARSIPLFATAPVIAYAGYQMILILKSCRGIPWYMWFVAVAVVLVIPMTFSIAAGFGVGLLGYILSIILRRQWHNISWPLVILALLFIYYFIIHGV